MQLTRDVHQYHQHDHRVVRETKVQSVRKAHRELSVGLDNGQRSEGQYQFTLYSIVCSVIMATFVFIFISTLKLFGFYTMGLVKTKMLLLGIEMK